MYLGLAEGLEYDPNNADHKLIDRGNGLTDTVTFNHNSAKQDWLNKSAIAPVYGTVVNNFSYKSFDLSLVLTYSLGGYRYDGQYAGLMTSGPSNGANLHKDLFNAWKNPGDSSEIPLMDLNRTSQNCATSDRWLRKGSYLNVSAVNMSYRLPEMWINQIGVKRARLFVSAENLHFFSAKKGFNPVGSLTGASGNNSYTHARTLTFGVNIGF